MRKLYADLMETASMLFVLFMGGLVVFALILPCFLD